tara:strand:- start:325 stop:780 length:456 start_codon:yes stop_codon:yes gene_type:complete
MNNQNKIIYLDRYVCVIKTNGCHECVSHKPKHDGRYYSVKRNGKSYLLHRLIFEELKQSIPNGLILRHSCDNVLCVNPEHLLFGTHKQNAQDAVDRNRTLFGERNHLSKLTEQDIIEIRKSTKDKWYLSEYYGVNERTIRDIKSRRSWFRV